MSDSPLHSGATPQAIVDLARTLGQHIAEARLRRGWTQKELAAKAGVSRLTMRRVEQGHMGTGIGPYLAALWAMGLEGPIYDTASLASDTEGVALARRRAGTRARPERASDDDF